jgi:hypothetical protein
MVESVTARRVKRRRVRTAIGSSMRGMITWERGEGKQGMKT